MIIRNATLEDAARLVEIYDYYVQQTAITFEYQTPSVVAFQQRMKKTMEMYPYLVIVDNNTIMGYAYAGHLNVREAYDWSCEMTIYLDPSARKKGYGKKLYFALEEACKKMGITNFYACIGYPQKDDAYLTKNSAQFHAHLGYKENGYFHHCGYKFHRWYDMIWMEKIVDVVEHPKPIIPYPNIKETNR